MKAELATAQKRVLMLSATLLYFLAMPFVSPAQMSLESPVTDCPGDCNGSLAVEVSDLLIGVNIALGRASIRDCPSLDMNSDGRIPIGELVRAVSFALSGCPCGSDTTFQCDGSCPMGSDCAASPDLEGCVCISRARQCGDTAAACNGECPSGSECAALQGFPFPECACVPEGTDACGGELGQCGGSCPDGSFCTGLELPLFDGCTCLEPGHCGLCPREGFHCGVMPGADPFCVPEFCGGEAIFPTCGGTCPIGKTCQPVANEQLIQDGLCVCATEDSPCEATCGGISCPTGEVCAVGSGGCSCQPV